MSNEPDWEKSQDTLRRAGYAAWHREPTEAGHRWGDVILSMPICPPSRVTRLSRVWGWLRWKLRM